jgi:hypothetical protein
MGGIPFSKMRTRRVSGTTSVTANDPAAIKKVLPKEWAGCTYVDAILNGEGVYIEGGNIGTGRTGINCPSSAVVVDAGQATYSRIVNLSTNVWVAVYNDVGDSNKGKATVITKTGTTLSAGTPVVFNNAATTDIDAKKITSTTFVISYIDDGGDDYLGAIIGTVSGTTITFGDEKLLVSAAITKTAGTGVAVASSTVIAATYQLAGDTKHYIVAAPFAAAVIDDAGTPVEVVATASTGICMDAIASGRVVVGYQVVSTNYATTAVCTVSDGAVCVAGTPEAHTSAAASSIFIRKASENRGIMSWIDTGDLHIFAFDIGTSGTTLNEGADATVAGTVLTTCPALFSDDSGVIAYEDDAHAGDYGTLKRFTIAWAAIGSGGVVTLASVDDIFAELSIQTVRCDANDTGELVVLYDNTASSNATTAVCGQYRTDIVDIRSSGASAKYYATLLPVWENVEVY